MMRRLLSLLTPAVLLALLCAPAPALAWAFAGTAHPAASFVDGIKAYEQGHYSRAARSFLQAAENGEASPALCYNLGNAFLRAGELGKAVLWYERGIRLDPADPDLQFNLAHARSLVKDAPEGATASITDVLFFPDRMLPPQTVQWLALGGWALFWLACAGLAFRSESKLLRATRWAGLALTLVFLPAAGYRLYADTMHQRAVVLDERVTVRSGLSADTTALFTLHAGSTVRIEDGRDGHVRIVFGEDKIGWVDEKAVGRVVSR